MQAPLLGIRLGPAARPFGKPVVDFLAQDAILCVYEEQKTKEQNADRETLCGLPL